MTIAQSGGPHKVDIYVVTAGFGPDRSPLESYTTYKKAVTCFVQSMNSIKSEKADQIGKSNTGMITFFTDPGVDVNQKYLFLFTNGNGTIEYHTFEGYENQSGLGRVFNAHTEFSTQKPQFFTVSG